MKYETSAGYVTRADTLHKLLDHLAQLIDQTKQAQDPAIGANLVYTKMISTCDSLIDQSAVIAHLHKTETSSRDRALGDGWLAVSHTFQLVRVGLTTLTKRVHEPQPWRDMTVELEQIKYKLTKLGQRTLQ